MPNSTNISLPIRGMQIDLSRLATDLNTYSFALNAITADRFEGNMPFLQNEGSNVCAVTFPPNYQVVGFREVPEQHRTIYMLKNPTTGNCQIGEVLNCNYTAVTDKIESVYCKDCPEYVGVERTPLEQQVEYCYCQYRLIVSNPCLAFDVNYPVDIEYKITSCSLNIYFTDALNERRYIYFKYTDDDPTKYLTLSDDFKICTSASRCVCANGYTYDSATDTCVKTTITPIEPSGDIRIACAATNAAYTNFGIALYNTFNINGTGASTIYHTLNTYWSNPSANTTDGVLNRAGLWACNSDDTQQSGSYLPLNENIGFIFPVTAPSTKTYYVGIAGDNKVRIRVDCVTVVDMDPNAVGAQYGHGAPDAFKYWHVYPISLTAGRHIIELTGVNFGSVAGFGAEIYNNTAAEIIAATSAADLSILFTTHDMRGLPLQVSSTFSGTCPSGACIDVDSNGALICVMREVLPPDCDDCRQVVCQDELDCDKIKVHPTYVRPCVDFIDFVNGGNLQEGTYQVLVAYADVFGNPMSSYFPSTQTAPLFENPVKFETNIYTNKALSFTISGLKSDSLFQYYNIVIAKTVDSFTEFILVGTFSVDQTSYTYTGFEQAPKRLAPQEVFFKRPFYKTAKGVTSANNYLFYTGVKEYPTLNLQPVANAIKLQWQTVALKEKAYYEARNTFYFHTFMRDEVYPLAIVFEFDNGRETCAFHIPGRAATDTDLEVVTGDDVLLELDCENTLRNKRWQVYNTASVVDGDYTYNDKCAVGKCWEFGEFAYWESTERYPKVPEVWGNLCDTPIRHHKFPDSCITHIHDSLNGTKTFAENNYVFPIGIKVDHDSVSLALNQAVVDGIITQAERDAIKSYRIVRGNRVGHKSIDAKGLIFNMWRYTRNSIDYYYPNYPYNDLRNDDFLAPTDATYDGSTTSNPTPSSYYGGNDRFTFHSPDVHFVNSGLGTILKLETEEYGKSEGYFTHSECQAKHKFPSTAAHAIALGFGVAAALSATGEKVCKVIEHKADYHTVDYPVPRLMTTLTPFVHVSVPPPISDTPPVGGVFIPSAQVAGSAPAVSQDTGFYQTWFNRKHNNRVTTDYDNTTGLPTPVLNAANESYTSCKGETYQLINANLLVNGILGFGGAGLGVIIQKVILGILEANKVLETMKALIPYKNYSIQYNSVGKYNNYKCVPVGNKNHKLTKTAYLEPVIQRIDEPSASPSTLFTTVNVNNWERERSVYLKTADAVTVPTVTDNSRFTMDEEGLNYDELDVNVYRNISSYYASVKRLVPNQYGQICNIEYLETNGCSFIIADTYTNECLTTVFGGDTFINRFALKRKLPFFLHNMCKLPNGSDVLYSELGNVAYPNYYFDTEQPLFERLANHSISIANLGATLQAIVGTNATRLDAKTAKFFYQNGYAHLFSYGIPYFFVESDVNVDYRHAQNNTDKDFYPHNTDLKRWFEEEFVPINTDNYYFYNKTYSKQNKESGICTSCILRYEDLTCANNHENRIIYSEPTDTENKNDNWLIFKANSYYDFPLKLGKLITADGIENDKVLVRFTKGTQIFSAYNTIQATEENIQVGTGGIFQSRPRDLATTDLGYGGTQHKDILHTEFGHIWGHASDGQIFNLATGGQQIDEISKDGMRSWFKENLPFQIKKDFPSIQLEDLDNNLNGIGLHYCFDKRFGRFLITKLDYKKVNNSVLYNTATKTFYILDGQTQIPVKLTDARYFCNKSWTISYSVIQKSWTSFHTYKPRFYVESNDTFDSAFGKVALNDDALETTQKLYTHNATNKSFQVFYGKLEPFIVEILTKPGTTSNTVNSVTYSADTIRYHNEFDTFYNRLKTFNKAIVYNDSQASTLLTLKVSNPEDLTEADVYPKRTATGYEVLVTNSEATWQFNDFWDVVSKQTNNMPIFNYDCNNVNKQLNYKALNGSASDFERALIRGKMCRVRLINDAESNYKIIVNMGQIQQKQSFR